MPIDANRTFLPVNIAILTVSDTRDLASDRSGDSLAARVEGAGHRLAERAICRDDVDGIEAFLRRWVNDPEVD
uniref:MogA/MoaB family molybdenum cofactor biosynthesis protein n=1 Tax=Pseudomonas aeruginosa TaxID=287 RepID=UPI0034DADA2A